MHRMPTQHLRFQLVFILTVFQKHLLIFYKIIILSKAAPYIRSSLFQCTLRVYAGGKFIFECSQDKVEVGSSSLFREAPGYMEEVEDLADTSHSQSCREAVALYVIDSKRITMIT